MKPCQSVRDVLEAVREGALTPAEAESALHALRIEEVSGIARLDLGRGARCGLPEIVLAEGKESGALAEIAVRFARGSGRCLVSRVDGEQLRVLRERAEKEGLFFEFHERARIASIREENTPPAPVRGVVGVLTAGTADIGAAEEARVVAEEMGCRVRTAYDVGVAGIHRLFHALKEMGDVDIFVVAAGREGTLPAIVSGLVDRPVIGVPVSSGYGYMGRGQAALASMLQSCAVLAVVNIDAGVIAGAFAAIVARRCGA